jgi:hypothetical protein
VLEYVPQEWVGELHMMSVAHLLGLRVFTGSFETGWGLQMAYHFSQGRHFLGLDSAQWGTSRLSTRSRRSQSLNLIDALSSAYLKKKKGETAWGGFPQGTHALLTVP